MLEEAVYALHNTALNFFVYPMLLIADSDMTISRCLCPATQSCFIPNRGKVSR